MDWQNGKFGDIMSFWINKRVLVTGHTGFKGGWLVKFLKLLGANVYGISLPNVDKVSFFNLCSVSSDLIDDARIDVTDQVSLKKKILEINPDIIFHLAAQPIVGVGYQNPRSTFATNVMGVVNLLDVVRKLENCGAVVNVTTDKVYNNKNWDWPYRECDQLGGNDPYSASKACAELVTHSYHSSFLEGRGIATARAGNVIGGGDFSEYRLIPDIVRSLANKSLLRIYNPGFIRPWQHVLDPIFGYIKLAELLYSNPVKFSGSYNFSDASTEVKTVSEVVEKFEAYFTNLRLDTSKGERHFKEESLLLLDNTKAKRRLNWSCALNFQRSIDETIEWYNEYLNGENVQSLTEIQISRYLENIK